MATTITIDELPEAWVLSVRGELDYGESAGFRLRIDRILRAMPAVVVVDFSQVDFLDSSGLGLLLRLQREYEAAGGRLLLVTNETVDSVLEMTRLACVFSIEADVPSAIAGAPRPARQDATGMQLAAPDAGTASS